MADFIGMLVFGAIFAGIGFAVAALNFYEAPLLECQRVHNVYDCELVAIPVRTEGTKS